MSLMVLQGKAKGKGKFRHQKKDVQSPHATLARNKALGGTKEEKLKVGFRTHLSNPDIQES